MAKSSKVDIKLKVYKDMWKMGEIMAHFDIYDNNGYLLGHCNDGNELYDQYIVLKTEPTSSSWNFKVIIDK